MAIKFFFSYRIVSQQHKLFNKTHTLVQFSFINTLLRYIQTTDIYFIIHFPFCFCLILIRANMHTIFFNAIYCSDEEKEENLNAFLSLIP